MSNFNQQWWTEKNDKALANSIHDYITRLVEDQSGRQDANFRNMRLYGNLEASALRAYSFYRAEPTSAVQNRVTLNIVQSMVDTVVSKLAKNKPKPSFLTEGGNWELQRKAQRLTQFLEGQFQATKFYSLRERAANLAANFCSSTEGSGTVGVGGAASTGAAVAASIAALRASEVSTGALPCCEESEVSIWLSFYVLCCLIAARPLYQGQRFK